MFDSVIFDLDGTLWDTPEICAEAWNEAISERKLPIRQLQSGDIAALMGLTSEEIRNRMFPDLPEEEGRSHLELCFRHEIRLLKERGGILYPDVANGLKSLSEQLPLFIVSNCDPAYLEVFLESSGLKACFTDWECHGATGLSKGENIVLLRNRNQLRSPIYIGDTAGDQKAATHARLPFGYAEYGFGQITASDYRFKNFREVVQTCLQKATR